MAKGDYANMVIDELQKMIKASTTQMIQMMGESPGREPISTKDQMEVYTSLDDNDLAQLEAKHGKEAIGRYVMDMEKRRRRAGM